MRFDRWTLLAFVITGAIGPALILLMHLFPDLPPSFRIATIMVCPAWVFGVMESSWGSVATWLCILVANLAMWSLIGALFAMRMPLARRVALLIGLLLVASDYSYRVTASLVATLVLAMLLIVLAMYRHPWKVGHAA